MKTFASVGFMILTFNFFMEKLVQESLHSAFRLGALETKDIERIAVDTTVQPKAITFPTDAKLRYKPLSR